MVAVEIVEMLKLAEKKKATGDEMKLLFSILQRTDDLGRCLLSNDELSKLLNVSVPSITRWLAGLQKKELILMTFNFRRHQRNIYPQTRKRRQKFRPPEESEMSEKQLKFRRAFPDKVIDCVIKDDIDIDEVIARVKRSTFLMKTVNITLKSILGPCYKRLMAGGYEDKDYLVVQKTTFSTGRNYTKEEMNALFQSVDEIEI